jgi:hypothetical protein
MTGASGEISERVRRVPKPKSSQVAAATDPAQSVEPAVEAAARRRSPRHPKETLVASDGDAAPLPPGMLTNAVVTETIPAAASVVRLNTGLYAVKVGTSREDTPEPNAPPSPVWVGPLARDGGFEALSAVGRGEQWLRETETNFAVRVPMDGALMMATAFGSGDHAPSAPRVVVQSLDGAVSFIASDKAEPPAVSPQIAETAPPAEREIRTEITTHIEREGDRVFAGSTWGYAWCAKARRRLFDQAVTGNPAE